MLKLILHNSTYVNCEDDRNDKKDDDKNDVVNNYINSGDDNHIGDDFITNNNRVNNYYNLTNMILITTGS